jgi:thiol:disulfide interchange protein DsbD
VRLLTPLLLPLLAAAAYAAPALKLEQDRPNAMIAPGEWFDVLLHVDPQGEKIAADGLEALPGTLEGALFEAAIFPAPDAQGAYGKPFTVRVPLKLARAQAYGFAVTLKGKTAKGAFEARAERKFEPFDQVARQVGATVSLKEPAVAGKANAVVVKATVIDGYHVYGAGTKDGVAVVGLLLPAPGARGAPPWAGGGPASPPGDDLHGTFTFEIPFTPARAGRIDLRVLLEWQACTERFCDPNEMAYLPLAFEAGAGGASGASVPEPASGAGAVAEAAVAAGNDDLERKGLWQLVLAAIGAGIVALLMPCTYPLIPITISFFAKQADAGHRSAVPLALAYGTGIVVIFTLIGLVVGVAFVSAENVLNIATSAWLNGIFAFLFLVFGLSLLGLFEIRLPSFFDDLAAKASGTGGYLSVFVMGLTLVITSFTCTVPFIGSLLVFAAKQGRLGPSLLAMAVFGLTMAIPFVLLSLSPKGFQALPRSGEWMKRLKVTLGIVELGLVLKFVSNVDIARSWFLIDRELFLVLWAASFLAAGLYLLGTFDLLVRGAKWSLGKGRAVAGILMLAITGGLAYGATGAHLHSYVESFLPQFKRVYDTAFVAVTADYEEGLRIAREKGAQVFLHFTGYT